MKKLLMIFFGAVVLTLPAGAQSSPGRSQILLSAAPAQSSGYQSVFQPNFTPIYQPPNAIAEAITPDIEALAGNLGNDPTRIFNYVHDQIRYVHYFGSKKGAELTLLERSGNDFDQCALLSALLQAAGYTNNNVGYQFGLMPIPYDNPDGSQRDLHHLLALSLVNTNWQNTSNYFATFFGTRGNWIWDTIYGDTNHILFQRIWVTFALNGTNYFLDPSFKVSEPITSSVNVLSAMGLNTNTLLTSLGGTSTGNYVSGLNEPSLRSTLQNCNSNLLNYLSSNLPNASISQIIGGQQIVSSSGQPLSTSLLFTPFTNSTYPLLNWTWQPTNFMGTLSLSFDGTSQTWYTPQLQGQRVSLTSSSNGLAQLWLQDSQVLQVTNSSHSNTFNVILTATHPYGGWNSATSLPTDTGVLDQSSTNAYQATNASYAICYAFEASPAWLQKRQQQLDTYRQQGYADSSVQVTTETLNVMGLNWMVQTELALELLGQEWGQLPEHQHRLGRMAEEFGHGYYIDIYLQLDGSMPATGYNAPDIQNKNQVYDVSTYLWSAMEHGVIEEMQASNLLAASTVKMLEIASTNSQTVYLLNATNYASVLPYLTNYPASASNNIISLVENYYTLLLPQNGSNVVSTNGTWNGYGYVEIQQSGNSRSIGMIIGGGYNGGFVDDSGAAPSPAAVATEDDNQQNAFNLQSILNPFSGLTGADPVNLFDGSFEITSTDLALGQAEPRGLHFTRYYSSARRTSNPAGMGPGWLHNFYCAAVPVSAPQLALGQSTAQQMAPMLVATCAALNIYNNISFSPRDWLTTAMIAKWGVDQTINNSVSVNLGNDTLQFTKQPNGQYTPPANCTMTLQATNGAFWLQERHGRTFKFGANTLLTNLVDQYGQAVRLSYNNNGLVTNIVDWKGHYLAFQYTKGTVLTNVIDSTGRSVSYGYTGSDLTSYTDAERATNGYAYDTNHDVLATYDSLGRLVVTNIYDGFGHVNFQYTQGLTNKMWQVYASGFYTVEIDPAGGEQVMTYDSQSRLIAQQDAIGNTTQFAYDGQNHLIQSISPLGETNEYIYDGNNNVIQSIDPLGFTNQFIYNNLNNLIATIDPLAHSNTFGYNAQFSLVGQTNGAGDWINYVYNTNGTLFTKTDIAGTTQFGYDTNGQANNITFPNSLGSVGFFNSPLGDVLVSTNGRGFTTAFSYNNRRQLTNSTAPANIVTSMAYDVMGNPVRSTDALGNTTTNSWSVSRHLLTTTFPATLQGRPVITNGYDNRDWLIRKADPLNNAMSFTNDPDGRLISTTDPLLRTSKLVYDADSRQLSQINAANETNGLSWDSRGSLIRLTDGAGHYSLRAYDAAGNRVILTNRNVNKWQFQFDAANRLTNTISPLSRQTSVAFNHQGLPTLLTDPKGQHTTNTFDALGRLLTRADKVGIATNAYDGNNNLTNVFENGNTNVWTYDAYNHVSSYRDIYGNLIQYRYDANGNLTNLIYPGSRNVFYAYDTLNRLTNVTDWSSRKTSFAYDLDSHLTSITRPNGTYRTVNYDAAGQVTNIWEQMSNGLPISWFRLNWTNSGNMAWEFAAPLPHTNSPPTRTMTYNPDNQLSTVNTGVVTNDSNGNLVFGPTTNSAFVTFAYDARNRLLSAAGVTNVYDALNNRVGQLSGTNVTAYIVNPNAKISQVLMRIRNGVTNYYVYGLGLLYQVTETPSGTNTLTYHYDYRGSTVALSGGNGLVSDRMEYSLYGSTTYRAGTNDTPFLFVGNYGVQTDPNGLAYMRARYYNPYLCRFINADPTGFSGGLNFYAYVAGNPVSNEDPLGTQIPTPANFALGWSPGYGQNVADWNSQFQAANQQSLAIQGSMAAGFVVSGGITIGVTFGAPLAVSGLMGFGMSQAAATATVTATLGGAGLFGGVMTINNTINNVTSGNLDGVAFDLGTIGGGSFVGGIGGGRYIADNVSGSPSTVPYSDNPFTADSASTPTAPNGYGFSRDTSLPFWLDVWNWLGTGPTPSSGGGSAALTSSGVGTYLQSSPTGKGN